MSLSVGVRSECLPLLSTGAEVYLKRLHFSFLHGHSATASVQELRPSALRSELAYRALRVLDSSPSHAPGPHSKNFPPQHATILCRNQPWPLTEETTTKTTQTRLWFDAGASVVRSPMAMDIDRRVRDFAKSGKCPHAQILSYSILE
jgi:hypothetical protein